jgi:hypothetical protein
MIIIGADFHPEFQQIALVDTDTGEFQENRLGYPEEAEKFYRALAGQQVRVGMEASGHARWFERMTCEELWFWEFAATEKNTNTATQLVQQEGGIGEPQIIRREKRDIVSIL